MTTVPATDADEYLRIIAKLGFAEPTHKIPRSFTDGIVGEGLVGRRGAAIIVGNVVELSGCFDRDVFERVSTIDTAHVFEPPECWIESISGMDSVGLRAYRREAFYPIPPGQIGTTANLDPKILTIDGTPVDIAPITDSDTKTLLEEPWSVDLVANTMAVGARFPSAFGFIARCDDQIIGGVGCFTVYLSGIEVEIDTRSDYQRRGVATELAKRMLVECGNRSLECHWDAMNPESAALARKVGFVWDRSFPAYELRFHGRR